jgi:thiamine pyrophosphokinase
MRLSEEGVPTTLTDGAQEGMPLPLGESRFDYASGTLFSILGFSELSGLSVAGARWPLDQVIVPLGSSLTLSNEVTEGLTISLERGRAMLIAHPFSDTTF